MIWKAGIWKKYYVFHLSDFTIQYWENWSRPSNEIKHESNVAWGFLAYSLLYNPGD